MMPRAPASSTWRPPRSSSPARAPAPRCRGRGHRRSAADGLDADAACSVSSTTHCSRRCAALGSAGREELEYHGAEGAARRRRGAGAEEAWLIRAPIPVFHQRRGSAANLVARAGGGRDGRCRSDVAAASHPCGRPISCAAMGWARAGASRSRQTAAWTRLADRRPGRGHLRACQGPERRLARRGGLRVVALLGSSGCGRPLCCVRSRARAGALGHDPGRRPGYHTAVAERRNMAMVFRYALSPHMTMAQNMAYGLRLRRCRGSSVAPRAGITALLGLEGLADRPVN